MHADHGRLFRPLGLTSDWLLVSQSECNNFLAGYAPREVRAVISDLGQVREAARHGRPVTRNPVYHVILGEGEFPADLITDKTVLIDRPRQILWQMNHCYAINRDRQKWLAGAQYITNRILNETFLKSMNILHRAGADHWLSGERLRRLPARSYGIKATILTDSGQAPLEFLPEAIDYAHAIDFRWHGRPAAWFENGRLTIVDKNGWECLQMQLPARLICANGSLSFSPEGKRGRHDESVSPRPAG